MDRLNGTTDKDFWRQWQEHQNCLYRCCLKRMEGNRTEAEDALDEAMLKARDAWHKQTDKIEHVKAWLIKLTNNLCTDILEKRDRAAVGVDDVEVMALSPEWPRQEETPDLFATQKDLELFFAQAIGELPERLRETFILYLEKQESYQEIAAELHISYPNARKRISQARAILREQYQEYEGISQSDRTSLKTQNKPRDATSLVETSTLVSSEEPSEVSERGEAFEPINVEEPVMTRDSQSSNCHQPNDRTNSLAPQPGSSCVGAKHSGDKINQKLTNVLPNASCCAAAALAPVGASSCTQSASDVVLRPLVVVGHPSTPLTRPQLRSKPVDRFWAIPVVVYPCRGEAFWRQIMTEKDKCPLRMQRRAPRDHLSVPTVFDQTPRPQLRSLREVEGPMVGGAHPTTTPNSELTFALKCISMRVRSKTVGCCCPNPPMVGGATGAGRCPPYNATTFNRTPNHSIGADSASAAGVYEPFVRFWRVWADSGGDGFFESV